MGFRVRVSEDSFQVEPGVAVSVSLEIKNEGPAPVSAEISVEGIDSEWVAIPVPIIDLPVGEIVAERIFLKPPREPESIAGTYPFLVKVQRSDTGEIEEATSALVVKPFHNISVDVQPRRAQISWPSNSATVQVTAMNLGNVESALRLSASDIGDMFNFNFEEEQLVVAPGAQRSVNATVTPAKKSLIANARLQQYTVTCRSRDDKTVATATHAQIEQRAMMTPAVIWLGAFIMFIIAAFIVLLPKDPTIDTLTISPERQWMGEPVEIRWTTSNARFVTLRIDDQLFENLDPNGSIETMVDRPGELAGQAEIELTAYNGRRISPTKTRLIVVRRREPPPNPEILEFRIEPTEVFVDEAILVTYKLSESVYEAVLLPTDLKLPAKEGNLEVFPRVEGVYDYKIIARNEAGQSVEKSIRVSVKRGSKARIIEFRAEPAFVDPFEGTVTLTWQVTNALRVELLIDGERSIQLQDASGPLLNGTRDFAVLNDTTFTLRVWDDEGITAEQQVAVKMKFNDDFTVDPPPQH